MTLHVMNATSYRGVHRMPSVNMDDRSSAGSGTLPPRSTSNPMPHRPAFDWNSSYGDAVNYSQSRNGSRMPSIQQEHNQWNFSPKHAAHGAKVMEPNGFNGNGAPPISKNLHHHGASIHQDFEDIYTAEDQTARSVNGTNWWHEHSYDSDTCEESYDEDEEDEEDVPRIAIIEGRGNSQVLHDILYGTPKAGISSHYQYQHQQRYQERQHTVMQNNPPSFGEYDDVWSRSQAEIERPPHPVKHHNCRPHHDSRGRRSPTPEQPRNGNVSRSMMSSTHQRRHSMSDEKAGQRRRHAVEPFATELERTPHRRSFDLDSHFSTDVVRPPLPKPVEEVTRSRRHNHRQSRSPRERKSVPRRGKSEDAPSLSDLQQPKEKDRHDKVLKQTPPLTAEALKAHRSRDGGTNGIRRSSCSRVSAGVSKANKKVDKRGKVEEGDLLSTNTARSTGLKEGVENRCKKEKMFCLSCFGGSRKTKETKTVSEVPEDAHVQEEMEQAQQQVKMEQQRQRREMKESDNRRRNGRTSVSPSVPRCEKNPSHYREGKENEGRDEMGDSLDGARWWWWRQQRPEEVEVEEEKRQQQQQRRRRRHTTPSRERGEQRNERVQNWSDVD